MSSSIACLEKNRKPIQKDLRDDSSNEERTSKGPVGLGSRADSIRRAAMLRLFSWTICALRVRGLLGQGAVFFEDDRC